MKSPKFKVGDVVCFDVAKVFGWKSEQCKTGEVWVVDKYGTFEQNEEPSYDIFVEEDNTLYKHCRAKWVWSVGER